MKTEYNVKTTLKQNSLAVILDKLESLSGSMRLENIYDRDGSVTLIGILKQEPDEDFSGDDELIVQRVPLEAQVQAILSMSSIGVQPIVQIKTLDDLREFATSVDAQQVYVRCFTFVLEVDGVDHLVLVSDRSLSDLTVESGDLDDDLDGLEGIEGAWLAQLHHEMGIDPSHYQVPERTRVAYDSELRDGADFIMNVVEHADDPVDEDGVMVAYDGQVYAGLALGSLMDEYEKKHPWLILSDLYERVKTAMFFKPELEDDVAILGVAVGVRDGRGFVEAIEDR